MIFKAKLFQLNQEPIPSLRNFVWLKSLKSKNPTIVISTFKTDMTILGLFFLFHTFLFTKIAQVRNKFMEKVLTWCYLALYFQADEPND